jgi:hypothetical protein
VESTLIPAHPKECGWYSDWHSCNCGLFDTLVYIEPGENDEVLTHRVSVEKAINRQVAHAKSLGHIYSSQEDALQDFIANHWAWFEKI